MHSSPAAANRWSWLHSSWTLGAIVALGAFLRVDQYIENRSLWVDEIFLATNIEQRDFAGLMKPLDYDQGSPIGFLWAERLMFQSLGRSEYALRLIPLLVSLAALPLFAWLARRGLRPGATPLALFLFAISPGLIQYSAEVKQYSTDVLWALLLLAMAWADYGRPLAAGRALALGLAGALAVWFSHAAVFVLGGIGLVLGFDRLARRDWKSVGLLALPALLWLASFVTVFMLAFSELTENEFLLDYWQDGFMPLPPRSIKDIQWFMNAPLGLLSIPGGFALTGAAAAALLIGLYSLFASGRRGLAWLGLAPLLLALLASGLHKYPFAGRLMLFALPVFLLWMAEGVAYLAALPSRVPAGVLLLFLLFHPVIFTFGNVINPRPHTEIRPVVEHLNKHWQPGDTLYLYYHTVPMFEYYMDRERFRKGDYIEGVRSREDWRRYAEDLDRLRGRPRVWVMLSHIWRRSGVDEEKFFTYHLDTLGRQLDAFREANASVYLYDLSSHDTKITP